MGFLFTVSSFSRRLRKKKKFYWTERSFPENPSGFRGLF